MSGRARRDGAIVGSGAPRGNDNAIGSGAPPGNHNATRSGIYSFKRRRIMPPGRAHLQSIVDEYTSDMEREVAEKFQRVTVTQAHLIDSAATHHGVKLIAADMLAKGEALPLEAGREMSRETDKRDEKVIQLELD